MRRMETDRADDLVKKVGKKRAALGPADYHRRALKLWRQMERLNPNRRPRGFIFKAPTRALYDEWRRAQLNPRLW
jgi:hypothetical protein